MSKLWPNWHWLTAAPGHYRHRRMEEIENRGSRIEDQGLKIEGRGLRIEDRNPSSAKQRLTASTGENGNPRFSILDPRSSGARACLPPGHDPLDIFWSSQVLWDGGGTAKPAVAVGRMEGLEFTNPDRYCLGQARFGPPLFFRWSEDSQEVR
jgi:hypothetical protein